MGCHCAAQGQGRRLRLRWSHWTPRAESWCGAGRSPCGAAHVLTRAHALAQVGTICVEECDNPFTTDATRRPWLSALFVSPDARGQVRCMCWVCCCSAECRRGCGCCVALADGCVLRALAARGRVLCVVCARSVRSGTCQYLVLCEQSMLAAWCVGTAVFDNDKMLCGNAMSRRALATRCWRRWCGTRTRRCASRYCG